MANGNRTRVGVGSAAGGAGTPSVSPLAATVAALAGEPDAIAAPRPEVPSGSPRFVTRAILGEGGMGRVHEAEDLQFGRRVAMKELLGDGAELERRFVVEALVTGNLEHPGIPAVYERGTRDGRPFYAMKMLAGRPLGEAMRAADTVEERLALLPVIIQVAHTLGFAHDRGIVHRDVKPDNVMVGEHGEVWVVDWGIAKVSGRQESLATAAPEGHAHTQRGSLLGTPAFMAPEQARGDVDAIDARTDVFALGAILYALFTGRAPNDGDDLTTILAAALTGKRPALAAVAPATPDPLVAIVERAMSQDPAARFPNASSLARALERFLATASVAKPSLVVRAIAVAASVGALLLAALGALATLASVSTLREQGFGAYLVILFTVLGLGLTAIDGRTRGAHALWPVAAAMAAATLLSGLSATATNFSAVTRYLVEHTPREEWAAALVQGTWETLGVLAFACQATLVQVVVLALVARAHALRPRDGR